MLRLFPERPLRTCLILCLLLASWSCQALRVAFVNPGRDDEVYWVSATQAMQAAARSLGVTLETQYAQRDPRRSLALAQALAARPAARRPDYVILVNEKNTLLASAKVLGDAGIKSFAAFSGLLPQQRAQWGPRRGLPMLLGSLEPDAQQAGYLTAKALIERGLRERRQGADGKLHLLAIAGDRSTPTSIRRNEGMRQAVAEQATQVVLDQQVFADWQREQAAEQMRGLLQRHPEASLVWSGSDAMAFGAMEAAMAAQRQLLFSAINSSHEALQALRDDRLAALAGGHFMAGAWALVMLYDYHQGHDFADEGLELERPMFMLFGKNEARRFQARFGPGVPGLDFRPYSKALTPGLKRYRFDVEELLQARPAPGAQ